MQSPQVASNNDTAEAIQIAGEVVKYDSVRLQLNYSCLQRHVNEPFIHRRSDYGSKHTSIVLVDGVYVQQTFCAW